MPFFDPPTPDRRRESGSQGVGSGLFVAFEGGEGVGKSTQVARLAAFVADAGHEVVTTREPGGTPIGARVRALLLDPATGALDDRTEALLYAADRAEHVARVIAPALARDAVVITDRYIDSSAAYQGAGRALDRAQVLALSAWATNGLVPDLTVVLDLDPELGLQRFAGADRLEAESMAFHVRVREAFLELAAADASRYVVIDAAADVDKVAQRVLTAVVPALQSVGR